MDTEIEAPSELLESPEVTYIPQNNVPVWRAQEPLHKRKWTLFTPLLTEYYTVIDNPKRLPTLIQPLISKERAFTFGGTKPSYSNFKVYAPDEYGISRRLYINICNENFIVGAVGASLIGMSTRYFMPSQGALHTFVAQRLLLGHPVSAITKMAVSGSLMTVAFCWKVASRTAIGGVLYDALKRSRDNKYAYDHWMNAGVAGGICGLVFGIRGGLPHAWAAAAFNSGAAIVSEFIPVLQKDSRKP